MESKTSLTTKQWAELRYDIGKGTCWGPRQNIHCCTHCDSLAVVMRRVDAAEAFIRSIPEELLRGFQLHPKYQAWIKEAAIEDQGL